MLTSGGFMTRQRTLIVARMEASDWGRVDGLGRRSGDPRYWLGVPFVTYILQANLLVSLMFALGSLLRLAFARSQQSAQTAR